MFLYYLINPRPVCKTLFLVLFYRCCHDYYSGYIKLGHNFYIKVDKAFFFFQTMTGFMWLLKIVRKLLLSKILSAYYSKGTSYCEKLQCLQFKILLFYSSLIYCTHKSALKSPATPNEQRWLRKQSPTMFLEKAFEILNRSKECEKVALNHFKLYSFTCLGKTF